MATCSNCGGEVPANARYCPKCGQEQVTDAASKPPPLPLSPWGPPPAMQTAGGGAIARPGTFPRPLKASHIAIAATALVVFLFLIYMLGRGVLHNIFPPHAKTVPVVGVKGQPVTLGRTVVGVAFTDTPKQVNKQTPKHGHFLAVGIIVGNKGESAFKLDRHSVELMQGEAGKHYQPMFAAWGTPEQLDKGHFLPELILNSREVIAGIIVFDLPDNVDLPRLLVRDLAEVNTEFTGAIDLTKESREGGTLDSKWQ